MSPFPLGRYTKFIFSFLYRFHQQAVRLSAAPGFHQIRFQNIRERLPRQMSVSDFHILFPHLGKFLHTQQSASLCQFPIFLCQSPADCFLPLPYKVFRFLIISVLFVSNCPLLTRSPSRFHFQRIIWLIRFAGFAQKENIALPR